MNPPHGDASKRPLTVYIAALAHETNTFSPLPTTLRSFEEGLLHRPGDAASKAPALGFAGYGDALEIAAENGDHGIAGLCAWAQPAGPAPQPVYEALRDELLAGLHDRIQAGPVDAVFLVLHGAMVAGGHDDCEGDLLQRVRAVVGEATPVGALLDLHGNVSRAMADSRAVLVACKEYPHTDYPQRARELYSILTAMARGAARPRTLLHRVPMLGIFGTTEGPMRELVSQMKAGETRPGILSVSVMHGFPWADTPNTSACVIVVHNDDAAGADEADAVAGELAAAFFALRATTPKRLPIDQAIDQALRLARPGRPVVIGDGSDNPGGGAACDSTFVLDALLSRGVDGAALGMIWDPQAAAIAADAGVGARIALRIGGKVGPLSGPPLDVQADVLCVRRDAHQRGLGREADEPLGLTVALRVGGTDVVVNSLRQQVFSPACFSELGIDIASKRVLVVKSTQHFRAGFDPLCAATLYCDAPGSLNGNLAALPYQHLRRPVWPVDAIESPTAADQRPA